MKNIYKVLGIIALVAIIGFSMTACDDDNGSNGAGGGNGGSGSNGGGGINATKPAVLRSNASYNEAVAKLDELIAYCNNNPSTINNSVLQNAITLKTGMPTYQSIWSTANTATTVINSINNLIDTAEGKTPSGSSANPFIGTWSSGEKQITFYSNLTVTTNWMGDGTYTSDNHSMIMYYNQGRLFSCGIYIDGIYLILGLIDEETGENMRFIKN